MYNHLKIRIAVFLLPLTELFYRGHRSSSMESAILHHHVFSQSGQLKHWLYMHPFVFYAALTVIVGSTCLEVERETRC